MNWQLAQVNIARRLYDLDDPKMKGFVDGLDPVNALAERSDGFVWRLQTEEGDATGIVIYDDPSIIVNMSVWESLETLLKFVRSEGHVSIMKQRRDWFERPDQPYLVLWWIPENHHPSTDEAEERLNYLRLHGSSPRAFSARDAFPVPDAAGTNAVLPQSFPIHRASGVDADAISVFGRKAFIDAYGDANPPEHVAKYAEQSFNRDVVEAELGEPGFIFLLASSNDNIVAYAKLCADRPIDCVADLHPMQLERVYVDKAQQGAGIGADLIDACVATARECGFRTIWLAAWEENVRAHRFYERQGFHIVGKTYFMLGPERQEDMVMQRLIE